MIVSIIGPPASGKTLLSESMSRLYGLRLIPESGDLPARIAENLRERVRFLESQLWFHNAMVRNAFLAAELSAAGLDVLMDTCWKVFPIYTDCECHDDFERAVLAEMADLDQRLLPPVDLLVGLAPSREQLVSRAGARGAPFERGTGSRERVLQLLTCHESYYAWHPEVLVIDTRGLDFARDDDVRAVADTILAEARDRAGAGAGQ